MLCACCWLLVGVGASLCSLPTCMTCSCGWAKMKSNVDADNVPFNTNMCLQTDCLNIAAFWGYLASFGAFWGLLWLIAACFCNVLGLWLFAGWLLGMQTVKVHEWCLVCYGWLALCLCNNFHLAYLFNCLYRHVLPIWIVGFLCCLPDQRYCLD